MISTTQKEHSSLVGTIDGANRHLFSPAIQATSVFLEPFDDRPFDPEKHSEAFVFAFKWSWREKIADLKKHNPTAPFKEIALQILTDAPNEWAADEIADVIRWAEKQWLGK